MPQEYFLGSYIIANIFSHDTGFDVLFQNEENGNVLCQSFSFQEASTDFLFWYLDLLDELKWANKQGKMLNRVVNLVTETVNDKSKVIAIVGDNCFAMIDKNADDTLRENVIRAMGYRVSGR